MILKHIFGRLVACASLIFMACLMLGGMAMAEIVPSKGNQLALQLNPDFSGARQALQKLVASRA